MGELTDLNTLAALATGDLFLVRDISDASDKDKAVAASKLAVLALANIFTAQQSYSGGGGINQNHIVFTDTGAGGGVNYLISLPDVSSTQVLTVDIVAGTNVRAVISEIALTMGRSGATIFAYMYGNVAWASPSTAAPSTIRSDGTTKDSTSGTKPTVSAINNGIRITVTGSTNTLDQGIVRLRNIADGVSSFTITVTVT